MATNACSAHASAQFIAANMAHTIMLEHESHMYNEDSYHFRLFVILFNCDYR